MMVPMATDPHEAEETVLVRGDVVTPTAVLPDHVVVVRADRVVGVAPAGDVPRSALPTAPPAGTLVLPGLVDLHCHGGGGASFPDATGLDDVRRAAHEHLRHGTTTLVASLVTAPRDVLLARTALLADAVDAGLVAGIHLEGPFLSAARCGAQSVDHMRVGDPHLVRELAAAARGHLLTMTVAPEVPGVADGGDDVVAALVAVGALPSIGHTDASAEQVEAAVGRAVGLLADAPGARGPRVTATHLFNGMRPLHHRDPGPVAACLAAAAAGRLLVELVADGTHLAPATVRTVMGLVPDGAVLVTDAMAAAGMPDGDYQLGPMAVRVADGVARILTAADADTAGAAAPADPSAHDGAIAGGVAHLLDVVRATVAAGVPLVDAVRAASVTPASVVGRSDVGALTAGRRADVVVVTPDLRPVRVARAGVWIA